MNPIKKIGRHTLPILNVVSIRSLPAWHWRRLFGERYQVSLANGRAIYFTEAERHLFNQAMDEHALIVQVWGMCKSAGLRA